MKSENAQELINNLTMVVELADEDDQIPMNFAAITEVIVNTSAIVTQTGGTTAIPLQQQVNVRILVAVGTSCYSRELQLRTITLAFQACKNCVHIIFQSPKHS